MRNVIALLLFLVLLSGCTTMINVVSEEAPLSTTLDKVKEELRAFKYAIGEVDERGNPKIALSCGGQKYPLVDYLSIDKVKVTVSVINSRKGSAEGGIVVKAIDVSGGKSKKNATGNKLVLNLVPNDIPADQNAKMSKNGIGQTLLAVVEQLALTNDKEPCLKSGSSSTLNLGFEVEKERELGGEIDLVVFSIGGKKTRTDYFSNDIELTFNFGGALLKKENNK